MLAQLDYLAACRHWDILRSISSDLVPEEFISAYAAKIADAEAADDLSETDQSEIKSFIWRMFHSRS
jgi:hypothetical protein